MYLKEQSLYEARRSRPLEARFIFKAPLLVLVLVTFWGLSGVHSSFIESQPTKNIRGIAPVRNSPSIRRGKSAEPPIQHVPRALNSSVCTSPTCIEFAKLIKSNLAPNYTSIDPCQHFDQYSCGGFQQTHDYRPEEVSVSTRSILSDVTLAVVKDIVEGPYKERADLSGVNKTLHRSNFDKMKSAYSACMDEGAIKQAGVAPLVAMLEELEALYPAAAPQSSSANSTREELTNAVSWLHKNSASSLISTGTSADNKDPDVRIIGVDVGRLSLPSKAYYNRPGAIANYTRTIIKMFEVVAAGNPKTKTTKDYPSMAKSIIELESKLSKASADKNNARDVTFYYNPMELSVADGLVPQMSIMKMINDQIPRGYEVQKVIVSDLKYLEKLPEIITSTPREVLHAFFQWQVINVWGSRLHNDIKKPLRVFSNELSGLAADSEPKRWKVCIDEVDTNLGWILSELYVERAFGQQQKDFADRIIRDIKIVFAERLKGLDWMSDTVKERAARKVVNIAQQIGYPTASPAVQDPSDVNKYYAALNVSSSSYFGNGRSYKKYTYDKNWNDLLKPVDRNRWKWTSPTINANFNPVFNRIFFPAGILQSPGLNPALPDYVSYGAFGYTAGHELTHGFDNSGSQYDEMGRYAAWWDNSTLANFKSRAQCFINQYSNYTVVGADGELVHVNGKLTQGENIADAGGLASAFAAWQKHEKETPNQILLGLEMFSKEQVFYLSYSNWRCGKTRPAQMVKAALTDEHSPMGIREMGALANSRGFRQAFNCAVKQPTCDLW